MGLLWYGTVLTWDCFGLGLFWFGTVSVGLFRWDCFGLGLFHTVAVIYVAKFFKYFGKEKLKITLLSKLSLAAESLLSSHLTNRSLVLSLESI